MRYLYAVVLCLCVTSFVEAYPRPQPCGFGLQFEFLWLFPTIDRGYFVIDANPTTDVNMVAGRRKDNRPPGYPVYRLEGIFAFCNNEFRLRGTLLDPTRDTFRKVFGTNLFPTLGEPGGGNNDPENFEGLATSRIKIDYFNVEGFLGHVLCNGCPFYLSLDAGVEFARIDFSETLEYLPTDGDDNLFVKNRLHYWGWGPDFLVDASYDFPSCLADCFGGGTFSLRGEFRGALLFGRSRTIYDTFSTTEEDFFNVENDPLWKMVPVWGGRLSLNLNTRGCGCPVNIEVGYQALLYSRPLQQVRQMSASIAGATEDFYNNFGLMGPFAAIGVTF